MAIFTDYYRFERIACKSKSRMDCTASTCSYEELEEKRAIKVIKETEKRDGTDVGDLVIYYGDAPSQFGGERVRRADKSITIKGRNLSSVYVPDLAVNVGHGDFNNTADAIIFVFHDLMVNNGIIQAGAIIEMFIARGQNNNCLSLYNSVCAGDYDEEMNSLRACAG